MVNRFTTARSTVAMRRSGPPAIVTLAVIAALTALTADAAARQARPKPATEMTAPRDAGEPIMAIVSIKSQQVTFYDADGWILRAPVSTGTTGRETPAGVFAVIEKDKDHHSTMYDDAEMPNMQRITWNGIAQEPCRRRARLRRQDARRRQDRPSQGAGRRAEAEGRPQGRRSGDATRHRQSRRKGEARCRCGGEGRRQGGRKKEGRPRQGG